MGDRIGGFFWGCRAGLNLSKGAHKGRMKWLGREALNHRIKGRHDREERIRDGRYRQREGAFRQEAIYNCLEIFNKIVSDIPLVSEHQYMRESLDLKYFK